MSLSSRRAEPADAALVYELVCALADYEKLRHEVDATPAEISRALFAPQPRLFCDLAEWNGEAAGFAVWFLNFSTFRGRHGRRLSTPMTPFSAAATIIDFLIRRSAP